MKYPVIINSTNDGESRITLSLFISKEIIFFEGHFPQMPILPGVAQVDWAMFFARKFFATSAGECKGVEQIKFASIIAPDTNLFLNLQLSDDILIFKYFDDDTVYSSGKIKV